MGEFHGCWIMIKDTFPFAIRLPTFYSTSICLATILLGNPLTYLLLLKLHPFWLIVAVPTTSADASLPSPHVKSSFPSKLTDRNTADDKSDVLESLLHRTLMGKVLVLYFVPLILCYCLSLPVFFYICYIVYSQAFFRGTLHLYHYLDRLKHHCQMKHHCHPIFHLVHHHLHYHRN